MALQKQLFVQWHQWKDGTIDWDQLQQSCRPIRLQFEGTLQRVVDLGFARKERTPWAQTVHTFQQLLQRKEALWTFLDHPGIEPTNNAAERALRQSVIQRKISLGVQSEQRCHLPQPIAHGYHHPQATGPGYLAVPGAGLDLPSPRRADAIAADGSLTQLA